MAENKMKDIAKMFGVELNEPFNIKNASCNPYHFTNRYLVNRDGTICTHKFYQLLNGIVEIEKPILDKVEKAYLENALRPFKNRIDFIGKSMSSERGFYIYVVLKGDSISFPYFKKDTMYKGMELGKKYTLEESRLFK